MTTPRENTLPRHAEAIEAALDAIGRSWTRRESGWALPPGPACPAEIRVAAGPKWVSVDATLAAWDEITPASREALAEFLRRAQPGLRLVRMRLSEGAASVYSRIKAAEDVQSEMHQGIAAVSAACRHLARNSQALLSEQLAQAYLQQPAPPQADSTIASQET